MTFMKHITGAVVTAAFLGAGGCVTINVYFPAAAAEQAADKIIEEVWGEDTGKTTGEQSSDAGGAVGAAARITRLILDWVVPAAHAQQANLDISSTAIGKIEASMKAARPSINW